LPSLGCDEEKHRSVFDSGSGVLDLSSLLSGETLKMRGRRLDNPVVPVSLLMYGRSYNPKEGGKGKIAVSMLCSAILPGLGEFYLYSDSGRRSLRDRALFFYAFDCYMWYGYYRNHKRGKEIKRDYMDYADEHWDLDKFLAMFPCCYWENGCDDIDYYNNHCNHDSHYFPFIPKEDDEEEYYENIGKYDAFVYGWDDWEEGQEGYWTHNRTYYWYLRGESDRYLLRGDQHMMFMIVNRILSMIDAGWSAYRMYRGEGMEKGWSIDLESSPDVSTLTFGYHF
jgi:hypothetical protein